MGRVGGWEGAGRISRPKDLALIIRALLRIGFPVVGREEIVKSHKIPVRCCIQNACVSPVMSPRIHRMHLCVRMCACSKKLERVYVCRQSCRRAHVTHAHVSGREDEKKKNNGVHPSYARFSNCVRACFKPSEICVCMCVCVCVCRRV